MSNSSLVVDTYSDLADTYDGSANARSCWGHDTGRIISLIEPRSTDRVVADVGCGAGVALFDLARRSDNPERRYIGVDPAANLLARARATAEGQDNFEFRQGAFEKMPLEDNSIDFMCSVNAFHWCPDVESGVQEMKRVMRADGAMDHFFIGRNMGREFIRATTPIFLKFMGPRVLLQATEMRQHFTVESARELFEPNFGDRLEVTESYITYYDTVDGHLGWWVRIAPQLMTIPEAKRAPFNAEIHKALGALATDQGVPYTMHTIRVKVR